MTNRDKYKRTFSALHTSDQFSVEVQQMNQKKRFVMSRAAVAVCATLVVVAGSLSAAYAADVGGFREVVQMWVHGQQVEAQVEQVSENSYKYTYKDANGEEKTVGGGGVAFEENGKERSLTAEEVAEEMGSGADVEQDKDGRIWLYFYDQKVDITDQFGEDGICRTMLKHDGETNYFTIRDNGAGGYEFSLSNEGYQKLD